MMILSKTTKIYIKYLFLRITTLNKIFLFFFIVMSDVSNGDDLEELCETVLQDV